MQLTKDLINVIDSDAHAKDDDESLKPYLPSAFRDGRATYSIYQRKIMTEG